jgi:hypothetical protein
MTTRSTNSAAGRLVERLASNQAPPMREIASEIGLLLGSICSPEDARALRVALSRVRAIADADRELMEPLLAVLSGYERSRQQDEERRKTLLAFQPKSTAGRVLLELAAGPRQPVDIARALGLDRNDGRVTRAFRLLEEHALVAPADTADRRGRARMLTQAGIAAAREVRSQSVAPDSAVRAAVSECVETTINWMRMVDSQDGVTRLELERDASAHGLSAEGLLETFCHLGESAGLVDFDANGGAWSLRRRTETWDRFFELLWSGPDPFERLEAQVEGANIVLVTVGERIERWREYLRQRESRIDPEPERLVRTDPSLRSGVLVFDNDTLAVNAMSSLGRAGDGPRVFAFTPEAVVVDSTSLKGS